MKALICADRPPRTTVLYLPPELWTEIFELASIVGGAACVAHYTHAGRPWTGGRGDLPRSRKVQQATLRTRRRLALVCRAWYGPAARLLMQDLIVRRLDTVPALVGILVAPALLLHTGWTRRLELALTLPEGAAPDARLLSAVAALFANLRPGLAALAVHIAPSAPRALVGAMLVGVQAHHACTLHTLDLPHALGPADWRALIATLPGLHACSGVVLSCRADGDVGGLAPPLRLASPHLRSLGIAQIQHSEITLGVEDSADPSAASPVQELRVSDVALARAGDARHAWRHLTRLIGGHTATLLHLTLFRCAPVPLDGGALLGALFPTVRELVVGYTVDANVWLRSPAPLVLPASVVRLSLHDLRLTPRRADAYARTVDLLVRIRAPGLRWLQLLGADHVRSFRAVSECAFQRLVRVMRERGVVVEDEDGVAVL